MADMSVLFFPRRCQLFRPSTQAGTVSTGPLYFAVLMIINNDDDEDDKVCSGAAAYLVVVDELVHLLPMMITMITMMMMMITTMINLRRFAEAAAERHIPKCKDIKSNKKR